MNRILALNIKLFSEKNLVILDQGTSSIHSLFLGVFLARGLGINGFGYFSALWISVQFYSSLQQALIVRPLLNLYSKNKFKENECVFIQAMFLFQCVLVLLFIGVSIIILSLGYQMGWIETRFNPVIMALWISAVQFLEFFRRLEMVRSNYFNSFAINLVFLLTHWGILAMSTFFYPLSIPMVAVAHFLAAIMAINFRKKTDLFILNKADQLLKTISASWSYSKWLLGANFIGWFSGNGFILTAGGVLGAEFLGGFRAIQSLGGGINILFASFENYIPFKASGIFAKDGAKRMHAYLKSFLIKYITPVCIPLFLVFVFSESILSQIMGSDFKSFAPLLKAFCVYQLLIFLIMPIRFSFLASGKTSKILGIQLLNILISTLLSYPLLVSLGKWGLIAGLILCQFSPLIFLLKPMSYERA